MTIADAKADLMAALDVGLAGVKQVLSYEPGPGKGARPLWISLFTAGVTDTEWQIQVRVYSDVRTSVEKGQTELDRVLPLVEDALPADCPRSTWDVVFVQGTDGAIDSLLASTTLDMPREDY